MSKYNQKYNVDENFFRNFIISVLNFLNEKIYINQIMDSETIEKFNIPFFYNASGDERFWQDILLQQTRQDCIDINIVEGNIDVIPRGHLTLSSISIDTGNLTNKFVSGEYTKEVDGELLTYHAPIQQIPLRINFNIEIHARGRLMLFKIIQQLIEIFYKAHSLKFIFNGMVISARIGFPDDESYETTNEFTFSDPTIEKITIAIESETYFPIIDYTLSTLKSNRIESFITNTHILPEENYILGDKNLYGYMIDNFQSHYTTLTKYSLLNNTYNQQNNVIQQKNIYGQPNIISVSNNSIPNNLSNVNGETVKYYSVNNFFDKSNYSYSNNTVDYNKDPNTITDINHNLHHVNQFGIPTENLNDVLILKTLKL